MATIQVRVSDIVKACNNIVDLIKITRQENLDRIITKWEKRSKFYKWINSEEFKENKWIIKNYRKSDENMAEDLLMLCLMSNRDKIDLNRKETVFISKGLYK